MKRQREDYVNDEIVSTKSNNGVQRDIQPIKKTKVATQLPSKISQDITSQHKYFHFSFKQFDKHFPDFRNPCEIGFFSQDHEREFHADNRQLKYIVRYPQNDNVHFNLRNGFKQMIKRDDSKLEYIDDLLRWIISKPQAFQLQQNKHDEHLVAETRKDHNLSSLNTDFVCWRGLLTKILCTPHENREGWKIAVMFYRQTYFLCEFPTEEKKEQLANITERQDEMCYWGWKFEQFVTSDVKDGKPNTQKPVNNNEAFCSVVRSRLNTNSLVYGGEIDGIDENIKSDNKYIEYKTTRQIDTQRQDTNFKRFKLIKWWAQSFLVGITKIICGYRDDNGIVHSLEEYDTQKIPEKVKDIYSPWKPNICFNFLDGVLNFIKASISSTVDDSNPVYILQWSPGKDITLEKSDNKNSEYHFLPDWFLNWDGWKSEEDK